MNIFKVLRKNRLFSDFDDKEINKMFDCLHGHIHKYSRGRVVAEEGAPAQIFDHPQNPKTVEFLSRFRQR